LSEIFYKEKLYPLQDQIFKLLENLQSLFYLTDGTALSRFYLQHRYSDDLDFFLNDHPEFGLYLNRMLNSFQEQTDLQTKIVLRADRFCRLLISKNETDLKIEFVNDVPSHVGDLNSFSLYSRVDNIQNILANKFCAVLDRDEIKDVVDILYITRAHKISFEEMFVYANSKAAGIFPPYVAERLYNINWQDLQDIKWIHPPLIEELAVHNNKLIENILGL
jgi:predicted nucleotidyltransferase component of viral defense system